MSAVIVLALFAAPIIGLLAALFTIITGVGVIIVLAVAALFKEVSQ